jgi:oligopeptide/dipeptide ABC transporter ATP-binding protein
MTQRPLLELEHVSVTFASRERTVHAVCDCSLVLQSGEVLALVGESGSGKSTLARLIGGIVAPTRGSVWFRSQDLERAPEDAQRELRRRIQMVFQDPDTSLNPAHRVATILREPLIVRRYGSSASIDQRVAELLQLVRLDASLLERRPHQLSGGQKQRVAIARALAMDPEVLIADEPLSSLDVSTAASIAQLFQDLQRDLGITMLFISHDLAAVRRLATRVAVMYAGEIVESGPASLLDAPAHPFTRLLVASMPDEHGRLNFELVEAIDAVAKWPDAAGACGYRARCGDRIAVCATTPTLDVVSDNENHSARCHLRRP